MNNFLDYLNWENIQSTVLVGILFLVFILLSKGYVNGRKILLLGLSIFLLNVFINILGFTTLSDYLSVFGFTISLIGLINLFRNEIKNT